jgi:hypothetical protein
MATPKRKKSVARESIELADRTARLALRQERKRLREQIGQLLSLRRGAVASARAHCRASRDRLQARAERIRREHQELARKEIARLTAPAREACRKRVDKARKTGRNSERAARAEIAATQAYEQQVYRVAGPVRARAERAASKALAVETDAQVRDNLASELHELWAQRSKQTKASARKSRTEAFLEWVEAHPEEVATSLSHHSDKSVAREIKALEKQAATLQKLLDSKKPLTAKQLSAAGIDLSDCSSVDLDCHDPAELGVYLETLHRDAADTSFDPSEF